ncbi:hypothetical protein FOZ63_009750, partial [Perkinsus olseni]
LGRPLDEQALVPKVVTVLSVGERRHWRGSYVREHHQRGSPEAVEPAKLECTKRAAHRSLDSEGLQEVLVECEKEAAAPGIYSGSNNDHLEGMHIRFESWTDASSMLDSLAEALTAYHGRHVTVT